MYISRYAELMGTPVLCQSHTICNLSEGRWYLNIVVFKSLLRPSPKHKKDC